MNNRKAEDGWAYDEEHGISYPEIDITKSYKITNRKNAPAPLTLSNESGTETHSLVLPARQSILVSGNRMTKYIWVAERRGMIKVEIVHA